MITLNKVVVLGQAVPEQGRSDRQPQLCTIGYDRELRQYVRIWPTPAYGSASQDWRRWSTWSLDLERIPSDNRHETWAPKAFRPVAVDEASKRHTKAAMITELSQSSALSVEWLDDERRSIGLCKSVDVPAVEVEVITPTSEHGVKAREFRPYLHWQDECGKVHKQTLLDWGTYLRLDHLISVGMDNPRDIAADLTKALGLHRPDKDWYVLAGNQNNRRTSYLAISVFGWDRSITAKSWRRTGSAPQLVEDIPRLFLRAV